MKRRISLEFDTDGFPYLVTRTPITVSLPESIEIKQLDLDHPYLTKRERGVLMGLCAFKVNKEIAYDLNISERTVKFHVSKLLQKYRCNGRQELAAKFTANGSIQ